MKVEIGDIKNPNFNEHGQVVCQAQIKIGDGVGAKWEWANFVAIRGDVAATGNKVWAKLCAGDYTLDEGFETSFDHTELEAD